MTGVSDDERRHIGRNCTLTTANRQPAIARPDATLFARQLIEDEILSRLLARECAAPHSDVA